MAVLVYVVRLILTGLLGESVAPAGPVHTVFTVTGTSTDELNSTVQVRATSVPAVMIPGGLLVILTFEGVGTGEGERKREREREREKLRYYTVQPHD